MKWMLVPTCQIRKLLLFICIILSALYSFGQEEVEVNQSEEVLDSLYREDQFYIGFTFNLLWDIPSGVDQSGFSGGIHMGYTRDLSLIHI